MSTTPPPNSRPRGTGDKEDFGPSPEYRGRVLESDLGRGGKAALLGANRNFFAPVAEHPELAAAVIAGGHVPGVGPLVVGGMSLGFGVKHAAEGVDGVMKGDEASRDKAIGDFASSGVEIAGGINHVW